APGHVYSTQVNGVSIPNLFVHRRITLLVDTITKKSKLASSTGTKRVIASFLGCKYSDMVVRHTMTLPRLDDRKTDKRTVTRHFIGCCSASHRQNNQTKKKMKPLSPGFHGMSFRSSRIGKKGFKTR